MIEVKNLEVKFGDFTALKDTSFEVGEGEFFTLLGPSGCGKTTTLRTIAGFIKPNSGTVTVRGEDITDRPVEKRNIGMVFQNYALFPTMSVYKNIAFGLEIQKLKKDEIDRKVKEMAEKVDLTAKELNKKVSELSGGQQQRVAIARILVMAPEIICMDEPLSNLDAKLRVQLRNELKELQKKFGITSIYVTHDQEEALTLSDRIAVFNEGKIEQVGTPDDIYNHSATEFVCNFVGDINLLEHGLLHRMGAEPVESEHSYVRLERVHVNREAAEDSLKIRAVVREREFYGLYMKYCVDADGYIIKVIEKNSGRTYYEVGEEVTIGLDPSDIMRFQEGA